MKFDVNDVIGKNFGRFIILEYHHKEAVILKNGESNGFRYYYLCQCNCGKIFIIRRDMINKTLSCGCYRKEQAFKANYKPNNIRKTRIYRIWTKMNCRCYNSNSQYFKNYGGRGIIICDKWKDFENFYDWAMNNGYQDDLTIDRIDVNGNYEPSNCRWITRKAQNNNKTNNHIIIYNDIQYTLSQISDLLNLKSSTIRARLKRGWNIEEALNTHLKINQHI